MLKVIRDFQMTFYPHLKLNFIEFAPVLDTDLKN